MPRIGRYFPNSKVSDWTAGAFGGGAAEAGLITATGGDSTGTYGAWKWHKFLDSANFTVTSGIGELELFMVGGGGGAMRAGFGGRGKLAFLGGAGRAGAFASCAGRGWTGLICGCTVAA